MYNHNTTTLIINREAQTVELTSFKHGNRQNYPAIPFGSISRVLIRFISRTRRLMSHYLIDLDVVGNPTFLNLYLTDSETEATHVKDFLDKVRLGKKSK